jgi:hypothetical protein
MNAPSMPVISAQRAHFLFLSRKFERQGSRSPIQNKKALVGPFGSNSAFYLKLVKSGRSPPIG